MTSSDAVVYGYIKDVCPKTQWVECRDLNHVVTANLPDLEEGWHLSNQMFSAAVASVTPTIDTSYIIPFGACYSGVEYEWKSWISAFERLLSQMYWSTAVVHLDTEFNGNHSFSWDLLGKQHQPGAAIDGASLDWVHEQI